jgi:hypothetical protein
MIPLGNARKDRLALEETIRLAREFARWRNWNWSVWAAAGVSAWIAARFASPLVGFEAAAFSWGTRLAWMLPVFLLAPVFVFQQFLFSRFTVPPILRVAGVASAALAFGVLLGATETGTGTSRRLLRERVAYHCMGAGQPMQCQELIRGNPGALLLFSEEEQLQIRVHTDPSVRSFADLTEPRRQLIKEAYADVLDAYEQQDFGRMLIGTTKILNYVDDYNDTRSYESIARRGLAIQAEESRHRASEERAGMVRRQVAALEQDGAALFVRAKYDTVARAQLKSLVTDILVKDPENRQASAWGAQIEQWNRHQAARDLATTKRRRH